MPDRDSGLQVEANLGLPGVTTIKPRQDSTGDGVGAFERWCLHMSKRPPEMMVAHFKLRFRERVAEWMCAAIIIVSGYMFLSPFDVFESPTYSALKQIASQYTWGWFCLLLGTARLSVLTINGIWLPSYRGRSVFAAVSVLFWIQMTLGVLWSNPHSLGLAIFPVLMCGDMYAVYKALVDYKLATAMRDAADAAGPNNS